jgi:hypothetical protein
MPLDVVNVPRQSSLKLLLRLQKHKSVPAIMKSLQGSVMPRRLWRRCTECPDQAPMFAIFALRSAILETHSLQKGVTAGNKRDLRQLLDFVSIGQVKSQHK